MKLTEIVKAFTKRQTKTLRCCGLDGRSVVIRYQNPDLEAFPLYEKLTEPIDIGFVFSKDEIYAKFFVPYKITRMYGNVERICCCKDFKSVCKMATEIYKLLTMYYEGAAKRAEENLTAMIIHDKVKELIPSGESSEWLNTFTVNKGDDDDCDDISHNLKVSIIDNNTLQAYISLNCEMNTDSVLELEPFIKDFNDLVTVIKILRDKYPIID